MEASDSRSGDKGGDGGDCRNRRTKPLAVGMIVAVGAGDEPTWMALDGEIVGVGFIKYC